MVTCNKLLVSVNTVPLYFMTQIYIPSDYNSREIVINDVFNQIKTHWKFLKEKSDEIK